MLALLAVSVGCRTTPKINWDARIGAYSYDQAVEELGPPHFQSTLSDGTRVAQWTTGRVGNTTAFPVWGGWGPWGAYVGPGPVVVSSSITTFFLRLTFDPTGELQAWKRGAQ